MIDPSVKFDIVTMLHVIEHLEEPDKVLRALTEKLADNGLLVVETPNADDALISVSKPFALVIGGITRRTFKMERTE